MLRRTSIFTVNRRWHGAVAPVGAAAAKASGKSAPTFAAPTTARWERTGQVSHSAKSKSMRVGRHGAPGAPGIARTMSWHGS